MHRVPIVTPEGAFLATFSNQGLTAIGFPSRKTSSVKPTADVPHQVRRWARQTDAALQRVLAGKPPGPHPPLDLGSATEFQRRVWAALGQIPSGSTRTYGDLARQIDRPRAARAVGQACGANPIPLLIPCHRAVAATGLGGFSGGLDWKRRLLALEDARR